MAPHFFPTLLDIKIVSSEASSAPHCRFSPNTSFTFERGTKCLLWRLVPSPHSWPRSEPSRAEPPSPDEKIRK